MILGVPLETCPGERRVACVPGSLPALVKAGFAVRVQRRAGEAAGFRDADYVARGAELVDSRDAVLASDAVLLVRTGAADREQANRDLPELHSDQVVIGFCEPLLDPAWVESVARRGVRLVALEMVPRITRAQSVDALSSMGTVAGYRAVLLAAFHLPKMFPLLMTAAGTVTPAKVFVLGAGVAGLQAIATARRLGAVVEAYDVRPTVKEEVQSLGAKFVELPLETAAAQDAGGYASAQDATFYERQAELLARVVAASDVVITTAAVPGKSAPRLITAEMVARMAAGSVLVDLAAERGGNCEVTQPGKTVVAGGVTVLGPTNLPAEVSQHASQLLSGNLTHLVTALTKNGAWNFDPANPLVAGMLLTAGGNVVHPKLRELRAASAG